jgi:protein-tyrosine phosphatase
VIDLHCHVLPGIDDGPPTIEGSVALARAAANQGVRTLVATPHVSPRFPNRPGEILGLVEQLRARLATEELALDVRAGAEIALAQLSEIEPSELPRLCLGGGPWLLLESPFNATGPRIGPVVRGLHTRGFRIVLAHPERCPAFHHDPAALQSLVQDGVLTSITAGSLVGRFGGHVREFALQLVRADMVHSVASDAHDRSQRPPGMASELQQAGLGRLADWLTCDVPAAILDGAEIPPRPEAGSAIRVTGRRAWWRRGRSPRVSNRPS